MTQTLFALCQQSNVLAVKRVGVTREVQEQLGTLFQTQAAAFFDGVIEEIEFAGSWKPDRDELLYIDAPPEAAILEDAVAKNAVGLDQLEARAFATENIRALFTAVDSPMGQQILIQRFTAQQTLARKFALLLDGTRSSN